MNSIWRRQQRLGCSRKVWRGILPCLLAAVASFWVTARAAAQTLGDLNRDASVDLLDIVALANHLADIIPLPAEDQVFADTDQDGRLTQSDLDVLSDSVLGLGLPLGDLPLTSLRDTSPRRGESLVALTRETVLRLTQPLAAGVALSTDRLHAEFGGRRILARTEVSSDRKTVTLFYLEPLPASARIRVTFRGDGLRDILGRELDLDGDGIAGGVATLDFDTVTLTVIPGTRVAGRVFASELVPGDGGQQVNFPLQGVIITVDGMEETLRATTDAQGNFRLDPAPTGSFFVHIDGRTAINTPVPTRWPEGPYYPTVGKAWESIPGEEVNLGNIYLPLVTAGTLQPVSDSTVTQVRFPDDVLRQNPGLEGVVLEVPPNALFSENGTRGGRIGIAPVAPDRLPSALPPGVSFPLVITVQTDGASNFDRPVPVCFPNLPDPVTGRVLAAGDPAALWSFNHDLGDWEIVGSMTTSADGRLVCSDPGSGILQPGWHGSGQGTSGRGGPLQTLIASTRESEKPGKTIPRGDPANEIRIPCPEHKNRYVILYRNRTRPASTDPAVADPVYLFNGEFYHEEIDLWIPGRGFDFVWSRRYRSQFAVDSAQGVQWDFSYNIFLEANGADLVLQEGTARNDFYVRQPDGSWVAQGLFRRVVQEADGSFTLAFESLDRWRFNPLSGPSGGRIRSIEDRNGNVMRFEYDGGGRLVTILDTLDRPIRIAYAPSGRIARLTDFAGREVRYEHFETLVDGEGNPGDLKSVVTPAVRNTVTGNDFPNGKKRSYTYTTGDADDRLNHNLLTITDGRRNDPGDPTFGRGPYLVNHYSAGRDPEAIDFDRIVRQQWGDPGEEYTFNYQGMRPSAVNGMALTGTLVRDREGHVKEYHFDRDNQLVALIEFTGRSRTDQPVDGASNRPVNRLRPSDPSAFVTRYTYNDDFRLRRLIFPNGNFQENVYESDLNPNADARTRGNLRKVRLVPSGGLPGASGPVPGAGEIIEETYDYAPGLGDCCGGNFVSRHVDGDGNETRFEYDAAGNRTRIVMAEPGAVMEFRYNEFGQLIDEIYPPSGGNRRRDSYTYHANGPMRGYLASKIQDADHLQLTTRYEYDAVGNLTVVTDARGNRQEALVNERNQVVRQFAPEIMPGSGVRYAVDYHYDANDNIVRVDQLNVDENGVVDANRHITTHYEYEILNHLVRIEREIDENRSIVEEYAYDHSRNLVLERHGEAVAGRSPARVVRTEYDERDHVFRVVAAPGDPSELVTQFDYDANGNLIREIAGAGLAVPRITRYAYDGFDRRVRIEDPMGNEKLVTFDRRHNKVAGLIRGEILDQPGLAGNVRLNQEEFTYDRLNRLVRRRLHHFDPATQQPVGSGFADTLYEYDGASLLVRQTDPNGRTTTRTYDTVYRPAANRDAHGNGLRFEYDPNSNLAAMVRVDRVGNLEETTRIEYTHDALNRVIAVRDPTGASRRFAYNSRSRRTRVEDLRNGNVTRIQHDGQNRILEIRHALTATGEGGSAPAGEIVVRRTYDDDDFLTSVTDGNGNVSRFEYDARGRQVRHVYPDGSSEEWRRDAFGQTLEYLDPNGTRSASVFDLAGRMIERNIVPAPGIAASVTRQTFALDGVGNLRRMEDEQSLTEMSYDSMALRTAETRGGRTVVAAYDGVGVPRRYLYPGGREIRIELDELNRPTRFLDGARPIATLGFLGANRLAEVRFGNGTVSTIEHDATLRVRRMTHSGPAGQAFLDLAFTRDTMDNRTGVRDLNLPGGGRTYAYDSVSRLVRSSGGPLGDREYRYDAVGNRTSVEGPVIGGEYQLGAADSPTRRRNLYASTPSGPLTYDKRGSRLSEAGGGVAYEYDFANRLVRFRSNDGVDARYVYDPLGRRIEKRVSFNGGPEVRTQYHYLGLQLLEEQDGNGQSLATYVYRGPLDSLLHARIGPNDLYYHADDQGSILALSDATGAVVESYAYDDFGMPRIADAAGNTRTLSAFGNERLFQGREHDPESGLYYFRSRYLDPADGRFLTQDSMGLWFDGINLGNGYTFAGNNPQTLVDPIGFESARSRQARLNGLREDPATRSTDSRNRSPTREVTPTGTKGRMARRPLNGSSAGFVDYAGQFLTEGVGGLFDLVVPEELQPNWAASHEHYFSGRYEAPDGKGAGSVAGEDDYGFGVGGGGDMSTTHEKWDDYNLSVDPHAFYDDVMDWARDFIHDDYFDTLSVAVYDENGNLVGYRESYSDKGYDMFTNNCQHYADDLRAWYDHLLRGLCEGRATTLDNARARFGDVDVIEEAVSNPSTPWYQFW
ncbi:MAG: RHS repeat-associated core domain-containing protein [Limisphaerales bacterium]